MENLFFDEKGGVLTASVRGELDHFLAASVRARIDAEVDARSPSSLVLDISGTSFMDSSGLGLIMGRYSACRRTGVAFILAGADERALKILDLAGLRSVIDVRDTKKGSETNEKKAVQ